jgi:hypothetical protein
MPCGRTARSLIPGCALLFLLAAAPPATGQPASFDELLDELSSAIAGAVASMQPVEVVAADATVEQSMRSRLARRGVSIVERADAGAAVVSVACSTTLSERLCAAELRRGTQTEFMSARRAHDRMARAANDLPLVLQVRPLFVHDLPILDVTLVGQRLLVLHPSMLGLYERVNESWRVRDARPTGSRGTERDVRGRLTVDGNRLEAFLPWGTCRGTITPFDVNCGEGQRPWPIGVDNAGLAPSRNYFISPEGMNYYAIVPLAADTGARWIAATDSGHLALLDEARRAVASRVSAGDDVAGVKTPCSSGNLVIVPARASAASEGDTLRLFRVAGRRLSGITSPVVVPGTITALWTAPDDNSVIVVCYNPNLARYEAFQVVVSCGR